MPEAFPATALVDNTEHTYSQSRAVTFSTQRLYLI